jgi:hypothetical protein
LTISIELNEFADEEIKKKIEIEILYGSARLGGLEKSSSSHELPRTFALI